MKPARIARISAGRSTLDACRAARISLSTLRKLEAGEPATERVARRLAAFYGISTDLPFRRHRSPNPGGRSRGRRPRSVQQPAAAVGENLAA